MRSDLPLRIVGLLIAFQRPLMLAKVGTVSWWRSKLLAAQKAWCPLSSPAQKHRISPRLSLSLAAVLQGSENDQDVDSLVVHGSWGVCFAG